MEFKLDPEKKAEWLKALRSGEYTQARKSLCNEKGNCCLGVYFDACEIGEWGRKFDLVNDEPTDCWGVLGCFALGGGQSTDFLPDSMIPREIQVQLSEMNDADRADFETIARWIEINL